MKGRRFEPGPGHRCVIVQTSDITGFRFGFSGLPLCADGVVWTSESRLGIAPAVGLVLSFVAVDDEVFGDADGCGDPSGWC